MSRAAQQRVIEDHQATIKRLRAQLAQAKADSNVFHDLTELCDQYEANGLKVIPVAILRHLRPRHHGVYGGQPLTSPPEGDEDAG